MIVTIFYNNRTFSKEISHFQLKKRNECVSKITLVFEDLLFGEVANCEYV